MLGLKSNITEGGKNVNKKRVLILTVVVIVILVFVLFFRGNNTKQAASDQKITIRWTAYAYPEYDKFRTEQGRTFEKEHKNVTVNYDPIPGSAYTNRLMTQIVGGTAPDVFVIPPGNIYDYAKRGALLDLTPYLKKYASEVGDIYPQLMRTVTFDEKVWGLPSNANTEVLFYNRKIFRDAGIAYPEGQLTWTQIAQLAKKLTRRDARGRVTQFGVNIPKSGNEAWLIAYAFGAKVWSDDGEKCTLNTPQMIEAITYIKDQIHVHKVAPSSNDLDTEGAIDRFANNRMAMYPGLRWVTSVLKNKSASELDWSVAAYPKEKKAVNWILGNIMGISAKTKKPEMAVAFLLHMIRPEAINFFIEFGDSIPLRSKGIEQDFFLNEPERPKGENQAYLDGMKNALIDNDLTHPDVILDEFNTIVWKEVESFYLGKSSATEALARAEKKVNELLKTKK